MRSTVNETMYIFHAPSGQGAQAKGLGLDDQWMGIIGVLPGVSVTLLAIAFVAFQINHDTWTKTPIRRAVVHSNLVELSAPLFFSLIVLFPGDTWQMAGTVIGLFCYLAIAVHLAAFNKTPVSQREPYDWRQLKLVPVFFGTATALIFAPIQVKVSVAMWMLLSGLFEAWWSLGLGRTGDGR